MKWQKKLNKTELKHLHKVAECHTLTQFKTTVAYQEKSREEYPLPGDEPCWECKAIARKLGLIE